MTNFGFSMLQLRKSRLRRNHLPICYSANIIPPPKYPLTIVKPISFVWYVIPLLKTGALASTLDLFLRVYDEKTKKNGICMTNFIYRPQYLPNGGVQWLLPKLWTSSIKQCTQYCTGALLGHLKGHLPRCICWLLFFCLLPLWPPGGYVASSCPMAVSRGFQCSPGHAALGNTSSLAPTCPHGHWNGPWQSNILMPSLILSLTITIAKYHVLVILN